MLAFDPKLTDLEDKYTFKSVRKNVTLVRTQIPFLPSEPRCSKLVFIARDLNLMRLTDGLRSCLIDGDTEIEIHRC
jgi:hypothetical protein